MDSIKGGKNVPPPPAPPRVVKLQRHQVKVSVQYKDGTPLNIDMENEKELLLIIFCNWKNGYSPQQCVYDILKNHDTIPKSAIDYWFRKIKNIREKSKKRNEAQETI